MLMKKNAMADVGALETLYHYWDDKSNFQHQIFRWVNKVLMLKYVFVTL